MFVLAVTGGVASGKSLFASLFAGLVKDEVERFDCDHTVHVLLEKPEIHEELRRRFGNELFDDKGVLSRSRLGERVFASESDRIYLEGLLHPKVMEQAQIELKECKERINVPNYILFEVPLLYEVDFSLQRDTDVVVAVSLEVQRQRLKENRSMSNEMIDQVLAAQLPMEEKISRAERVIWNDSSEMELLEEAYLLKAWIDKKVGE